ncbi:hypothetical protein N1851_022155 [Merluccius polli]|uniref:Reverse transcriptase domain-containing protein n=1 Tax=Merluccius polli TaxID=89951 RepID=A0AA47NW39_MERPO|nr:hypothetical protein N1851_022155 [Merluccius polli]
MPVRWRELECMQLADTTVSGMETQELGVLKGDYNRDLLRFLWIDEFPKPYEEVEMHVMRIASVPFGASPSPFLLAVTIRHHLKKYEQYPTVTSTLDECLYVDYLICSVGSAQESAKLSIQDKIILQDAGMMQMDNKLCRTGTNLLKKCEWNNELPEYLSNQSISGAIAIPRCYDTVLACQSPPVQKEVHVFSDASESVYCTAAYLRVIPAEGECSVTLITSEIRVAPLKKVTLPRLELLGALIGARHTLPHILKSK